MKLGDGRYGVMYHSDYALAAFLAVESRGLPSVLPSAPPQRSTRASINSQTTPQAVAQVLWETILTKCGDSWFYYGLSSPGTRPENSNGWQLAEYRGVIFSLKPESISTAERMNGLQWLGHASMGASVHRTFGPPVERGGVWSGWLDFGGLGVTIIKRNGEWIFDATGEFNPDAFANHKLACGVATAPFSQTGQSAPNHVPRANQP